MENEEYTVVLDKETYLLVKEQAKKHRVSMNRLIYAVIRKVYVYDKTKELCRWGKRGYED